MKRTELQAVEQKMLGLLDKKTVEREISFALQIINKSDVLAKCSQESKQSAVLNIANIGLTLNPALNLAYLVPRYDRASKGFVCTLMPSYQGLVKLLTDSGSVTSCEAQVVYKNDEFVYELGTEAKIKHVPHFGSDRGDIIGVYAIAHLHNGQRQIELMNADDIEKVMEMSESYKAYKEGKARSCVWIDHKPEMCRKTILKRLTKYLPKTERYEQVANAIEADNQDYVLDPFGWKAEKIEYMAGRVYGTGTERHSELVRLIPYMTESEADKIIIELERDMPNEVTHGLHGLPNQTKTAEHFRNVTNNVE